MKNGVRVWSVILWVGANALTANAQETTDPRITIEIGNLAFGDHSQTPLARFEGGADAAYGAQAWLLGEFESFMEAHPNIRVTTSNLAEPKRANTPMHQLTKLARNIVGLDLRYGGELGYLINNDLIIPIDFFLPDPDFSKGEIWDALWKPMEIEGLTWGVPWAAEVVMFVCNRPLYEAAGLDLPTTTAEMNDSVRILTKDFDGDGNIDQWGRTRYMDGAGGIAVCMAYAQSGGSIMNDTGFDMTHPALVDVIMSMARSVRAGYNVFDRDWLNIERTASRHILTSKVNIIADSDRYALIPVPTDGKQRVEIGAGLFYAIRRSTPQEERASWELIKWLSRRDVAMPQYWGGYPVRKDFIDREDFRERTKDGARNLELMYTSMEYWQTSGNHFRGKRRATREAITYVMEEGTSQAFRGGPPAAEKLQQGLSAKFDPLLMPLVLPKPTERVLRELKEGRTEERPDSVR